MSDEPDDVADITSICGGLNINIGTLNKNSIEGMFIAGKKANELSHKILLDPVGAGASKLRTDTAVKLAKEIKFDVIRGNISEIKTLALGSGTTKGVDADVSDAVTEENLDNAVAFVKDYAKKSGCVIAITGAIDPDNVLEATAAAVCTMGLAGEIAFANMAETDGNSTYRNRIIDAIYNMDAETLEKGAKYELR